MKITTTVGLTLCVMLLAACYSDRLYEQNIPQLNEIEKETEATEPSPSPPAVEQSNTNTTPVSTLESSENADWDYLFEMGTIPVLVSNGSKIGDFVPEGWTLLDSAELDYNGDGYSDFVGVLWKPADYDKKIWYPRIIFYIFAENEKNYKLEFQDIDDFISHDDSTAYDNPHESITSFDNTFIIRAAGSGTCKCLSNLTYKSIGGEWLKRKGFLFGVMYKYANGEWIFLEGQKEFPYIPPKMGIIPQLRKSGNAIADFVPKGWTLLDSAKLDYNGDGYSDFVGVLEHPNDWYENIWYPRILFSIAGQSDNSYRFEFQDITAIRNNDEGGVYGDPYMGMSTDGSIFTTHAYGGSSWRWSESVTYKYADREWWVKSSEYSGYRWGELYYYKLDDYETGTGKRMQSNGNDMLPRYEVKYEVPLDPAPTLQAYNENNVFADERLEGFEVNHISVAEGIDCGLDEVQPPSADYSISDIIFINTDYILYVFKNSEKKREYLAVYNRHSMDVMVVTCADCSITNGFDYSSQIYKDKIFYSNDVRKFFKVRKSDGSIVETNEYVATCLYSINLDGSDNQLVFEYKNDFEEKDILDDFLPYISLIYEITGGQIIVQVYDGSKDDPFYRLNLDGSIIEYIDSLPEEQINY